MSEPQIPDAAVEAAAEAIHAADRLTWLGDPDWADLSTEDADSYRDYARKILAAAYPHLAEQWRVGTLEAESVLVELVNLKDGPRDGAYRTAKELAWTRARAVLTQITADRINEWRRPMPDTADPMPVFVIKGKDQLAVSTIECYRTYCEDEGLTDQAEEVGTAIAEIEAWQQRNPDAVKLPDHPHVPASTGDGGQP